MYLRGFFRFFGIRGTKYSGPIILSDITPPIISDAKINNLENGFND